MLLIGKLIRLMQSGHFRPGNRGGDGIGGDDKLFTKERKQIKNVIKQTMMDMSDHVINKITDEDVPVRTGHYVGSHVVQTIDPSYPRSAVVGMPPFAPRLLGGASSGYRAPVKSRLKTKANALIAKGEKQIHFGNAASYAHLIEYVGWVGMHELARTGPYFIFKGAEESLKARKKEIAMIAKKKVFK